MNVTVREDDAFFKKFFNKKDGTDFLDLFQNKTIKDLDLFPPNWNITSSIEEIPLNADFAWLLGLLLLFLVWATYYVYYNSRLLAFIVTVIINQVVIPRYFTQEFYSCDSTGCCKCKKSGHSSNVSSSNGNNHSKGEKNNSFNRDKHTNQRNNNHHAPFCHIGSLSISFISGKIMFREFAWIQPDYTLRILDGFVIFRWWVPYEPKDVRQIDCSHMDTRLFALLNGFELHIYNRSHLYSRLEKCFNLPCKLFADFDRSSSTSFTNCDCYCHETPANNTDDYDDGIEDTTVTTDLLNRTTTGDVNCDCKGNGHRSHCLYYNAPKTNDDLITAYLWRDLIPVSKIEISTGRFVFGNSSMPTILSFAFDEAHTTYTSKPSASPYDLFTHIAKSRVHRFKIILIPSPKYLGLTDDPPRYMGEGFVVIQCKSIEFHHYQDEPGFVSLEPEKIELLNGDIVDRITHPTWGIDIKCEKSCTFSYGPWSDRQREFLYNFFYPLDYQALQRSSPPKLGELRQFELFEFKINLLANSMIDILFTRENKETNVLHIGAGPGSGMHITIPWLANADTGCYTSTIKGSILHLDAKTCLNYRPLAESETFEFDLAINYPAKWNQHQEWLLNLNATRATVNLIFAHKIFFCDLIDDWSCKSIPDILHFVPYTWKINLKMHEFELITLANECNWIDCSDKQYTANTQLAITGEDFELTFDLPFVEFLPPTVPIKLWIQGQSLEAAIHVPKSNGNREMIESLATTSKLCHLDDSKKFLKSSDLFRKAEDKWHRFTSLENGWITCWSVPIVAISIQYTYHPSPPMPEQSTFFGPNNTPAGNSTVNSLSNSTHVKVSTESPQNEESILLQPLKPEASAAAAAKKSNPPADFYPGSLDSDRLELDIEIGPSNITLYGVILKMLWDLKENYVGECRTFTDITEKPAASNRRRLPFSSRATPATGVYIDVNRADRKPFDGRLYRPFEVQVTLAMHDVHAHLMKPCTDTDPVCPFLYFERLNFEMDKKYTETMLQLNLSPVVVNSFDLVQRPESFKYLTEGFVVMSSLQFRGHAMFSEIGRPLDSDTLEYAWLIDVTLGEITGRLTLHQLSNVVSSIDTIAGGIVIKDSVQPPPPPVKCLHDAIQAACTDTDSGANKICPNPEDIKYRLVRGSLSSIDISLAELYTLTNLSVVPSRLSMCNVHGCRLNSGVTGLIDKICLKQFLLKDAPTHSPNISGFTNHLKNIHGGIFNLVAGNWTEVFSLSFGPIFLDTATEPPLATASYATNQETFLKLHDERNRRLWFLWRRFIHPYLKYEKCGCIGGCAFFKSHLSHIRTKSLDSQSTLTEKYFSADEGDDSSDSETLHTAASRFPQTISIISEDRSLFSALDQSLVIEDPYDKLLVSLHDDSVSVSGVKIDEKEHEYIPGRVFDEINENDEFIRSDKTKILLRIDGNSTITISPITSDGLKTMTETISEIVSLIELNHLKMKHDDQVNTPATPGAGDMRSPFSGGLSSSHANATNVTASVNSTMNKRSSGPSSTGPATNSSAPGEFSIDLDRSTISLRQSPAPNIRSISQPIFYPNVIFGKFKLEKVTVGASFSGLKLNGGVKMFSVTLIHNQKVRSGREKWIESSVNAELVSSKLTLLEEAAGPGQKDQMIVKASLGTSSAHLTSQIRQGKENNAAHLRIGPILLDIPQQPSTLHGMVTRSSRQISTTIQELRSSRLPSRSTADLAHHHQVNTTTNTGDATIIQIEDTSALDSSNVNINTTASFATPVNEVKFDLNHLTPNSAPVPTSLLSSTFTRKSALKSSTFKPQHIMIMSGKEFVVQFSVSLDSFTIGAALLPSLRAQYQIAKFSSSGITGDKARYVIDVMEHSLSFTARVVNQQQQQQQTANDGPFLPSFAKVALPSIHVAGEYLEVTSKERFGHGPDSSAETVVLRNTNCMSANIDIGFFEHSLTTDLLNQLIIIQKEFVKEINDVVLRMSGGDIIVIPTAPATSEGGRRSLLRISQGKSDLFKLKVSMKGIQITATTPTNSAVRLSAGPLDLSMSNLPDKHGLFSSHTFSNEDECDDENATRFRVKLAIKIEVDLNVACKAEYHIPQIISSGLTGSKGSFVIDVAHHQLTFETNMKNPDNSVCLPSSTKVSLPPIHVSGKYKEDTVNTLKCDTNSSSHGESVVLRNGGYLNAWAEIDFFEHSLTTDLLNHLILVQKEFMKEVNLVVQKMSGGDINIIPIPTVNSDQPSQGKCRTSMESTSSSTSSPIVSRNQGKLVLFSLHLSFKGAQITATTPTNNAVRLETGEVSFHLSNSIQGVKDNLTTVEPTVAMTCCANVYFKLQFDFSVALGQIIRNPVFDEALPEFQPVAYFKTRVIIRNAFQNELQSNFETGGNNKPTTSNVDNTTDQVEAILVTFSRPLIYIQPLALDKAVLVWLNYKNAYEYWNEQRASVNPINTSKNTSPDVVPTTNTTSTNLPSIQQLSGQSLPAFLLQVTFDDLGICLPIAQITQQNSALSSRINYDAELKSALVVTLESTTISASSHGSLVSKGKFNGLCFRFAEDFETSLDDWKPDPTDTSVMNIGVVSEGTYEICSRTATIASLNSNCNQNSSSTTYKNEHLASEAKWFLNVSWRMEGFDIHVDTSIGKQLSALFSTLTALAGDEDIEGPDQSYSSMAGIDIIDLDRTSEPDVAISMAHLNGNNDSSVLDDSTRLTSGGLIMRSKSEGRADTLDPEKRRVSLVKDASFDSKKRSRLIETELNKQARIINELRQEGASQSLLESEIKKLQDLEFTIFNDFRRDVMKKLRRHSTKPSRGDIPKRYDRGNFMRHPTMVSPEKQDYEFTRAILSDLTRDKLSSVDSEVDSVSPSSNRSGLVESVFDGSLNLPQDTLSVDGASIRSSSTATTATTVIPAYRDHEKRGRAALTKQMSMIAPCVSKTPSTESGSGGSDPYLQKCGISSASASSPDDSVCMDSSTVTSVNKPVDLTRSPNKVSTQPCTTHVSDSELADSSDNSNDSDADSSGSDAPVVDDADGDDNALAKETPSSSSRPGHRRRVSVGGSISSSTGRGTQRHTGHIYSNVQEPNVDFELEVMVYFNSGKCVFHTREDKKDDDISASATPQSRKATLVPTITTSNSTAISGMVKEKSFAGFLDVNTTCTAVASTSIPSPKNIHPRYQVRSLSGSIQKTNTLSSMLKNTSHSRLRPSTHTTTSHATECTMFLIPGLDVKVHYNSKNILVDLTNGGVTSGSASSTLTNASVSSVTRLPGSVVGISKDLEFHSSSTSVPRKQVIKKASCEAWITLHCIPEETLITPHILDFLEQALEPIPLESTTPGKTSAASSPSAADAVDPESNGDLISSTPAAYAVYGSFPVDVIVYIHVQPSVLRFSCYPLSRVECLLQLPSVDLTFSSKRDEDELLPSNSSTTSAYEKSKSLPARVMYPSKWAGHRRVGSDYRYCTFTQQATSASGSTSATQLESCVAGMSMTGCLADFSLYIFHPYGGQKKSNINMPSSLSSAGHSDSTTSASTGSSSKPFSSRKDSLSLQVEFVKINITRSRKLIFIMDTSSPKMTLGHEKSASCQSAVIRFNGKCDVGSASFKYDMRRLTEILAFPKAWYRKAIWKRMFLGEESISSQAAFTESDDDGLASSSAESLDHLTASSGHDSDSQQPAATDGGSPGASQVNRPTKGKETLWLNLDDTQGNRRLRNASGDWRQLSAGATNGQRNTNASGVLNTPWETHVVFALELSKLNIMMNMGNVMGNTTWLSRGFKSNGRFSIDSSGHKGYIVKLGLDASSLDAKGGIVGGIIELSNIETEFNVKEDRGKEPSHALTLKLHTLQMRLDYMSTSILMMRISDLDLTLRDEWTIDQSHHSSKGYPHPTKRPALIFIHSHLVWNQLQILMSKSTTPDIIKICSKLEEFFTQQFHSSVRVFSSLEANTSASSSSGVTGSNSSSPANKSLARGSSIRSKSMNNSNNLRRTALTVNNSSNVTPGSMNNSGHFLTSTPSTSPGIDVTSGSPNSDQQTSNSTNAGVTINARHHRHWQRALKLVSGINLSTLPNPLPSHGTVLGGTMELTGKNISLACFYGVNFRSKAWAIFSLRQPTISFATEAQEVWNEVEGNDTHIIQNLSCSLGRGPTFSDTSSIDPAITTKHAAPMATVCRISRSVQFPPQFRKMHEWFAYTFASSDLDDVNRFPLVEFERATVTSEAGIDSLSGSILGGGEIKRRISASPKSQEFHHQKEVIFALPSFKMELKTEHLQAPRTPTTAQAKPSVDCTFVTDFDDHIFVAVDAEAYFFLHELITSYIRERETPYNKSTTSSQSPMSERSRKFASTLHRDDSTESSTATDWREFFCHTWHLEPTVRLLSWAGKNIEPYGVDYILQRLGFTQARSTIPKWIQRGAMDPLDKILSLVMYQIVHANRVEQK